MTLLDAFRAAVGALRANLLRSILTSLGIIIGVGAVIMMVSIGAGAERRIESIIQNMGANIVVVVPGTSRRGGVRGAAGTQNTLTEDDAAAIQREIAAVAVAAPEVGGSAQLIYGNTNWNSRILGITPEYFQARAWTVEGGRMFEAEEVNRSAKVAVVGRTVADKLFEGGDPVGQRIRIQRVPFLVIGVAGEKGQTPWGGDQDDVVFIPISSAKSRVLGSERLQGGLVARITVQARSAEEIGTAVTETTELLRQRHRIRPGTPDDFSIRNIAEFMAARQESSQVMTILLASVAAISLLVGGIGIMNIMLVSVTERTREIGLRMAVGARGRDVMSQFLVEASTLSFVGGALGIALGVGGSYLLADLADFPMEIESRAILIAVAFSAGIGLFFGLYPARKAARLDPIEALRHD